MTTATGTMNMCSFSYISLLTRIPRRATGIERTWDYIKTSFERQGDGLPYPTTRYFETIGQGPLFFAVHDVSVYCQYEQEWYKYRSSYDIVFDTKIVSDE
jgi:hypothetical protein